MLGEVYLHFMELTIKIKTQEVKDENGKIIEAVRVKTEKWNGVGSDEATSYLFRTRKDAQMYIADIVGEQLAFSF